MAQPSRRSSVYFPVCSVHGGRLSQPAIRLLDVRPPLADIRLDAFLDLFQTVLLRCHCLVSEKGLGFVVPSPTRHIRLPGHFTMILTPVSILRGYCRPIQYSCAWGVFQRVPALSPAKILDEQQCAEISHARILYKGWNDNSYAVWRQG